MSDETKHSPEPWHRGVIYADEIDDSRGMRAAAACGGKDVEDGNARRIVACVNACAGIPTEALEAGALRDAIWLLEVAVVGGVKTLQGDDQGKAILRALGRLR